MKKRFKIIKYKSVTLIFISFLLLFLIEFLLRLLWTPAKVSCQFTDDLYLFWKGTPNYISERKNVSSSEKYIEIKLNSFGFRSPEFKRNKKPGTYRIVCMGDSTTNGFLVNIEDAYPSLLQSFLKKKYPNREIEVINTGISGYSSFQGLIQLKRIVLGLKPDLITILYGKNDSTKVISLTDKESYDFNTSMPGRIREYLSYTRIYTILENVLGLFKGRREIRMKPIIQDPKITLRYRVSASEYEEHIREMIHIAEKHDIKIIFIKHLWLNDDGEYYERNPHYEVMNKIEESAVNSIDTKKLFDVVYEKMMSEKKFYDEIQYKFPHLLNEEENYMNLFYKDKVHPTELGHYIIAEGLSNKIVIPDD